ncbi:MAG TPA: LURP-one-related family protein [Ktedonobacterales bacterium]|nr:LURP-one-related family protein [Ktedonobacterales bacterium]
MRYQIREKLLHITEDSAITDETGAVRYQVNGKLFSLHDTLVMRDAAGAEVATIRRQLIALTPTYTITRGGQELAEVRKRLLSFLGERMVIDIPGPDDLELKGNLFEHEYTIERGGQVVATVSKRWFALSATYGVEVAPGEDDVLILATVLVLDLAEDREH